MGKDDFKNSDENEDRRTKVCTHAVEWAEHARSYYEDGPCDDGRAGIICGSREGEQPCPMKVRSEKT